MGYGRVVGLLGFVRREYMGEDSREWRKASTAWGLLRDCWMRWMNSCGSFIG